MSADIWSTAIGVGGAVIVAVTAFVSTKKSTDATIQAERGRRLWEKRAAAYESTLRALLQRKLERNAALRAGWVAKETQQRLEAVLDKYSPQRWLDVQTAILAYATDWVVAAVDASTEADRKVREANERWKNLQSQHLHATPNQKEGLVGVIGEARAETQAALDVCFERDNALIDLIRKELRVERYRPVKKKTTDLLGGPDPTS
jgi:hypothetical protein